MTSTDFLQAGGVLAFAGLVLYLLRELNPTLKGLRSEMFEMRITIAAILERERIRDARRRRESDQPITRSRHHQERPNLHAIPEEVDSETTDLVKLIEIQREAASRPRGDRPPRKGTHHDGEG